MPIHPSYQLLHSGYTFLEVTFDLYGARDEDGVEVCDVALVGDKRSLIELIPPAALDEMTRFVERQDAAARKESRDQARVDCAEQGKQLRQMAAEQ